MNDQQKQQYEEVREGIRLTAQERKEVWDKQPDNTMGEYAYNLCEAQVDKILSDPRIAILDKDQSIPPYNYDMTGHSRNASEMVSALLETNFRRILPKEE